MLLLWEKTHQIKWTVSETKEKDERDEINRKLVNLEKSQLINRKTMSKWRGSIYLMNNNETIKEYNKYSLRYYKSAHSENSFTTISQYKFRVWQLSDLLEKPISKYAWSTGTCIWWNDSGLGFGASRSSGTSFLQCDFRFSILSNFLFWSCLLFCWSLP